jgi:hypothetical protein
MYNFASSAHKKQRSSVFYEQNTLLAKLHKGMVYEGKCNDRIFKFALLTAYDD